MTHCSEFMTRDRYNFLPNCANAWTYYAFVGKEIQYIIIYCTYIYFVLLYYSAKSGIRKLNLPSQFLSFYSSGVSCKANNVRWFLPYRHRKKHMVGIKRNFYELFSLACSAAQFVVFKDWRPGFESQSVANFCTLSIICRSSNFLIGICTFRFFVFEFFSMRLWVLKNFLLFWKCIF